MKHVVFTVHAKDKYAALKRIVDYYPQIYGIIFCRTRKETQEIADKLMQEGYNADSLHGELSQAQRDTVMQKFRIRNLQLLVATDVAARGLDVDDLTHVINYGLPDDTESYTHRSGRTGRAGKTGTSIAIINLREKGKMREIERIIGKKFIQGEMPTGKQICEKQLLKVIDELEKVKVNEDEICDFMPDIYRKLDWLSKEDLIKRMVSHEFNRFLDYYRNREEIEIATGSERNAKGSERGGSTRQAAPGFKRLFINLGKMDNFFPNELISLLNSNTRGRIELGRIDLMQKFSFFEVEEKEVGNVVKALNRANWNGRKVSVEIAGEEGKDTPKGKRRSEGGSYGKKEFDGKSVVTRTIAAANPPASVTVNPNTLPPTRKRASPVVKSAVTPKHVVKKTTGNNSSRETTSLRIQNPTSAKKAGQDGHLKRNRQAEWPPLFKKIIKTMRGCQNEIQLSF